MLFQSRTTAYNLFSSIYFLTRIIVHFMTRCAHQVDLRRNGMEFRLHRPDPYRSIYLTKYTLLVIRPHEHEKRPEHIKKLGRTSTNSFSGCWFIIYSIWFILNSSKSISHNIMTIMPRTNHKNTFSRQVTDHPKNKARTPPETTKRRRPLTVVRIYLWRKSRALVTPRATICNWQWR